MNNRVADLDRPLEVLNAIPLKRRNESKHEPPSLFAVRAPQKVLRRGNAIRRGGGNVNLRAGEGDSVKQKSSARLSS